MWLQLTFTDLLLLSAPKNLIMSSVTLFVLQSRILQTHHSTNFKGYLEILISSLQGTVFRELTFPIFRK
jgi:hypothetical protein